MDATLNIAVAGFGRMGRIYAQTVSEEVDGARLWALVDPGLGRGDVDGLSVPNVYPDLESALNDAEIHGVVIASPTSTHADLVVQAAEAGIPIFCEKPLALTRADTERAMTAVEGAGVPLQVGFMRRFDEGYRDAYRRIGAGDVGQPVLFRSTGRDLGCPDPSFADPARSGGLILDMGIHDFDLARWLMGADVERVSAEGALLVCEELHAVNDIDNAVVNLSFEDGSLGSVDVSRNSTYGYDIRTEVMGTEGVVHINGDLGTAPEGVATLTPGHGDVEGDAYLTDRFGDAYRAQIHHFVECVRKGREPVVTGEDAKAAFEIGLAATFSVRTGEAVSLSAVRSGWTPDGAIL